jgi:uncharacterized protein (DUF1330 family)
MVISDGEFVAAIVISDVTIRNEEAFQIYRSRAAESMAKFGGRYLARNGAIRVLEGDWHPDIIVVVEFPSIEQAQAWYVSSEYGAALQVRDVALRRNLIIVEGVDKRISREEIR